MVRLLLAIRRTIVLGRVWRDLQWLSRVWTSLRPFDHHHWRQLTLVDPCHGLLHLHRRARGTWVYGRRLHRLGLTTTSAPGHSVLGTWALVGAEEIRGTGL